LDSNVLIALLTPDHTSFDRARAWFAEGRAFATCPITQGALLRFIMRFSAQPSLPEAKAVLNRVCDLDGHVFWPDDLDFVRLPERGIRGHRQVTDAYLAALAAEHRGFVATMDNAMAALHKNAILI
jgi:toxin-antitoxin system PIN domain toxin